MRLFDDSRQDPEEAHDKAMRTADTALAGACLSGVHDRETIGGGLNAVERDTLYQLREDVAKLHQSLLKINPELPAVTRLYHHESRIAIDVVLASDPHTLGGTVFSVRLALGPDMIKPWEEARGVFEESYLQSTIENIAEVDPSLRSQAEDAAQAFVYHDPSGGRYRIDSASQHLTCGFESRIIRPGAEPVVDFVAAHSNEGVDDSYRLSLDSHMVMLRQGMPDQEVREAGPKDLYLVQIMESPHSSNLSALRIARDIVSEQVLNGGEDRRREAA